MHEGNIGEAEDCRRVVREVIEQHGRLDILVNNAGITIDKTVAKMTDEDWHRVIAVNLSGAFFMAQAALEHMIERGTGRIISVSSVIGETGNIGQANYAASKSGPVRADQVAGQGGHLPAQPGAAPGRRRHRADRQRGHPRLHRHRHAGHDPGQGAGPDHAARSRWAGSAGRRRSPGWSLPGRRRVAYITGQIWAVNGGLDM